MQNNVDSSELNKKRGKRLKQAIISTGIPQYKIAEDFAHVTPGHLSSVVRGGRKLTEQLAALVADAAGVRKEWLLCEDDFRTEAEKEEAEKSEILRPDGPTMTAVLLRKILDRMVSNAAKEYGLPPEKISENRRAGVFVEVGHYADYLIEQTIMEVSKNSSDCEAKE